MTSNNPWTWSVLPGKFHTFTCSPAPAIIWSFNHYHGEVVTSKVTRPMQLSMGIVPHFSKKANVWLIP